MSAHRAKFEAPPIRNISQPFVNLEYPKPQSQVQPKRSIIYPVTCVLIVLILTIGLLALFFVKPHDSSPILDPHKSYGQLTEEVRDALCVSDALVGNATTDGRCYYNILTGVVKKTLVIHYENNLKCTYLLQTRHNCKIRYSFHVYTDQSLDFVNVTNGFTTSKYTGNAGIIAGITKEEFLKIYFQTDGSGIKDDMILTFYAVK